MFMSLMRLCLPHHFAEQSEPLSERGLGVRAAQTSPFKNVLRRIKCIVTGTLFARIRGLEGANY